MAQHRLIPPHGVLEARRRRAAGGTSHRRSSPGPPGARTLTTLVLTGIVAGGAVASTTAVWSPGEGLPGRAESAGGDRAGGQEGPPPGTGRADDQERSTAAPAADTADADTQARDAPTGRSVVTPAPPAAEPKTAAAAAPVWRADGPGAFRSTPWNTVRTEQPRMDGDTLRFSVSGPGQRVEFEPDMPVMDEGDEYYFAFSVRLDEDFPAHGSSRQVITQWKNDNPGSAPLDLRVWNGRLALHGGHGHPSGPTTFTKVLGPAPVERWTDVVVHVRFSADPENGSVSAWQDGEQVVCGYRPPGGTLYPGQSSYLKTGLSRDPLITRPAEVAFRDWTVGSTLESVR